jgi:hypothetical protein
LPAFDAVPPGWKPRLHVSQDGDATVFHPAAKNLVALVTHHALIHNETTHCQFT